MVEALIFDVDGTLAETEELHRRALNETFAEWGLGWHWSGADYARRFMRRKGIECLAEADRLDALCAAVTSNDTAAPCARDEVPA